MTTTVDSIALAAAYAEGVERGLMLAFQRISAVLAVRGGTDEDREILAKVIAGQLPPEMLAHHQEEPMLEATTAAPVH